MKRVFIIFAVLAIVSLACSPAILETPVPKVIPTEFPTEVPTKVSISEPEVDEMQYLSSIIAYTDHFSSKASRLADVLSLDNVVESIVLFDDMVEISRNLAELPYPKEYAPLHRYHVQLYEEYLMAQPYFEEGMLNSDIDKLEIAFSHVERATEITEEAVDWLERKR